MQGLKAWSAKHDIPVYLDECGCTVMQVVENDRFYTKTMESMLKLMHFILKMMDVVLKLTDQQNRASGLLQGDAHCC